MTYQWQQISAGVLAFGVVLSAPATSAEELVAALIGPIETAQGQGMQHFGERLSALTGGALTLRIFPDGQLGGNTEVFEQVKSGEVDLAAIPPGVMAEFVPEMQALVAPFVFRDFEHWKAVTDGPVAADLAATAEARADVMVLGYFGGSVRNLVSRRPVETVEDIDGLRVRLHPSEIQVSAWRSLGVEPTVIAYGEIYNALQLGVVDGLENEPEWVLRMKFHEQASHYVITEHEIVTRPLIFSAERFKSLSTAHQQAVLQAGREAAAFQRELEHGLDAESRALLAAEHGMTIVDVDKEVVRARATAAIEPVIEAQGLGEIVAAIAAQ